MRLESWRGRCAMTIAYWLIQLLGRTLRVKFEDRAGAVVGAPIDTRYIGALWHNRLLMFPFVLQRYVPARRGAGLISPSRDGAWITPIVERFGFQAVRGSSSRKGASAMLQLADVIAGGRDVVITPDGPRGPVYEVGPGIIFLAQKSRTAVIPVNLEYSSCWRVKSWDGFIVPRPFARLRVIFGEPHLVRQTETDEEFEQERLRLQEKMMALVEMR